MPSIDLGDVITTIFIETELVDAPEESVYPMSRARQWADYLLPSLALIIVTAWGVTRASVRFSADALAMIVVVLATLLYVHRSYARVAIAKLTRRRSTAT